MTDWFLVVTYWAAFISLLAFYYHWFFIPSAVKGGLKKVSGNPAAFLVFLVACALLLNILGFWEWDFWNWIGAEWLDPLLSIPLWSLWIAALEALVVLLFSVWPLWIAIAAFAVLYKK